MYDFDFTKEKFGKIISDLVKQLDINVPDVQFDEAVGKDVLEYFAEQEWPKEIQKIVLNTVLWVAQSFQVMYPHLDAKTRYYTTVNAVYAFIIDDFGKVFQDALKEFEYRLVCGKPQNHPILQSYAMFMTESNKYVGLQASLRNTISFLRFVCACIIELDYGEKLSPIPRGATNFPEYFRGDSGGAEWFASFIFPEAQFPEDKYLSKCLPVRYECGMYIIKLNDALAFYKEGVLGDEKLLYVSTIAQANDISVMEALQCVCNEVIQIVKNMRTVLSSDPEMLAVANAYIDGAFAWHVVNDERYHLSDIPIVDKNGTNLMDKYDDIQRRMRAVTGAQ